jgi:hypothetical protein
MFGIQPPVTGGRWTKDSEYLAGSGGTYIPLKSGTTKVSYEANGKTYTLSLKIVNADGDAASGSSSSSSLPPYGGVGNGYSEVETGIILK